MDNQAYEDHEQNNINEVYNMNNSALHIPRPSTISNGRLVLSNINEDTATDFNTEKDSDMGPPPSWDKATTDFGLLARRRMSRDPSPSIDSYKIHNRILHKSLSRPTLEELHENEIEQKSESISEPTNSSSEEPEQVSGDKFGWIEGVLIRNMLSIWGVMLFLRISWVVAMAGIWQTLIIIAISTFITLVTAMSMSAIATNGEIGGGGTYYVMSRILGPEFGGSIGIIFAIANAINASLNIVGFVQTVQSAMFEYGGYCIADCGINDTRILGVILTILVWALCGAGAKYEAKTQSFLLVILLVALTNFVVGSIIGPNGSDEKLSRGFLGYEGELFAENWNEGYVIQDGIMQNFFSVFSVYFPAGIGILAGANVSANLKDPSAAIPKGTILAIIITSISYAIVAIICAGTTKRQATGNATEAANGSLLFLNCSDDHPCDFGSYKDYQLMTLISAYGPLNYAGIFAATLSSSLASFVSCPQLLKVIGDDGLYPYWLVGFMAKGYGKSQEPHLAYLFTFVVSLIFVLIASLDTVALLISCFFLATFALMNYSTFHVSLIKPLGWRPTFRYYNMWVSLFVAALCVVAMFLVSWQIALATIVIVFFFYVAVLYRNPDVNWGSSSQARTYNGALTWLQELVLTEDHVKNYRPQILVLAGQPGSRPALIDFANLISKNNSLLICGDVIRGHHSSKARAQMLEKGYRYLRMHRIKGFCSLIDNMELSNGVAALLSAAGVGKMRPNILLLGYKNDWRTVDKAVLDQYFASIHVGFDLNVGVLILRLPEGLDYSGILADVDDPVFNGGKEAFRGLQHSSSTATMSEFGTPSPITPKSEIDFNYHSTISVLDETSSNDQQSDAKKPVQVLSAKQKSKKTPVLRDSHGAELPQSIANKVMIFQKKQARGYIDVWWLYDDGGLTLLLPHIVSTRSKWSSCQLRVLCTSSGQQALEKEHQGMKALLEKFRINFSDLVVIEDPTSQLPSNYSLTWFDGLIRPFIQREQQAGLHQLEAEVKALQYKTNRHLRLRELLMDHSSDASLVVMTLPLPRKGGVSAPLYMAWLESLTANMPPYLLVRGNQTSVLTFYS